MTDEIQINTNRYVYFTDDGTVTKILNYLDDTETHIIVEYDDVEDILSGKNSVLNYIVIFNNETSTYELKKRLSNNVFIPNISDTIHELSKKPIQNPDLTVIQDIPNKKWILKLSSLLSQQIITQRLSINAPVNVSITAQGDPHVLHRILTVKIDDIAKSPDGFSLGFIDSYECSTQLSLYTVKKLQSYKHEVINE